jgi:hypothetical protein
VAFAQPEAVAEFRNFLPTQIEGLSEEQRKHVPVMYLQAANLASAPFGDLVMQGQLNELMYGGLADYEGAKKAFQADLDDEPTGDLTVWQIHQLGYRSDRKRLGFVGFFPLAFGGTMTDDFASVQGTLRMIEERIAYPVNHVKIDCWKGASLCRYQQFVLTIPDENSWAQSYMISELVDETYRITRWENQQIDAVQTYAGACRINHLSFNFTAQEFYEIARNNSGEQCDLTLSGTLEPLKKPRVSQIVDGKDIVGSEFQRIDEEVYEYLASGYRKRAEEFREQEKAGKAAPSPP